MKVDIDKMGALFTIPAPGKGKAIKLLDFSILNTMIEYEIVDYAKIPSPGGLKKHVPECGHTKDKH